MALNRKRMAAWVGEYYGLPTESTPKKERPEPTPDAPLTVKQAAKRLNVSARTLYALCEDGRTNSASAGGKTVSSGA